ncbi:P-II family nitrogen regulator [Hydromonas duriensis]|uniref:Nitrogen regulatory protein P-II family n=1 Tax=Hydromonas duriensis TaxID=1527608 RepID=A0A4R6Y7W3_9BURK|nr:P-II family nitrogen regulator [Hydromonas duriensis]TDR31426.1 nitrogen regulatory protein P-II family [Hydromonas duriensis]
MKLISAIIRPEKLEDVKAALFKIGVTGMSLSKIAGHGGEHEVLEHYRGQQIKLEFQDKIELKIAVSEAFVDVTIATISKHAQTGQVGDGKIFVQPLERVVRIRTHELDDGALTPVGTDPEGLF